MVKIVSAAIFFLLTGLLFAEGPTFFVVIPTYKNRNYCIENIDSLVRQNYSDWSASIIVDGGPEDDDGTYDLLSAYIADHGCADRVALHKNKRRRYSLANIDRAIRAECRSDEAVVIILDGDDYFLHENVLARIAEEYQDLSVWLTYGQYINVPSNTLGNCRPFPRDILNRNAFREFSFISSHPRTFKAWLYKRINKNDLHYKGNFFTVTGDLAMMFPMLEMASNGHIRYIQEPLYAYRHYENNDFEVRFKKLVHRERVIRAKRRYAPIK